MTGARKAAQSAVRSVHDYDSSSNAASEDLVCRAQITTHRPNSNYDSDSADAADDGFRNSLMPCRFAATFSGGSASSSLDSGTAGPRRRDSERSYRSAWRANTDLSLRPTHGLAWPAPDESDSLRTIRTT